MLVHNAGCDVSHPSGGPWFDVVTGKCGGQ